MRERFEGDSIVTPYFSKYEAELAVCDAYARTTQSSKPRLERFAWNSPESRIRDRFPQNLKLHMVMAVAIQKDSRAVSRLRDVIPTWADFVAYGMKAKHATVKYLEAHQFLSGPEKLWNCTIQLP